MNEHLRSAIALSLLAASVSACSSDPDAGGLESQLAADTGTTWVVHRDARSGEVRFLAPLAPVAVGTGTPEAMTRAFFDRYGASLHAKSDQLRVVLTATDRRGDVHLRFEHFIPGTELRVFDSGSTAHFTADGRVTWVQSDFHADLEGVDRAPSVTEDAALAAAIAHLQGACGAVRGTPTQGTRELGVLANEDIRPTVAYRLTFELESEQCIAPAVFVDAKSGAPLLLQERAHSVDGLVRGSRGQQLDEVDAKVINVSVDRASSAPRYLMITETPRAQDRKVRTHGGNFPADDVLSSRNVVDWDELANGRGAAVDAHYYTTKALEYLRPLGDGFLGASASPVVPLALDTNVWVHYNVGPSAGANAFGVYDEKTKRDTLRFGDGNRNRFTNALPFSAGLDVVAHEVTHLITAHTSKLTYARESGALSESFSDVMGASAEHWDKADDRTNLLIGERLFGQGGENDRTCLRDMENPGSVAPGQPDHYEAYKNNCLAVETASGANDFCNVHHNSGIPNRAFALMVRGGIVVDRHNATVGVPRAIPWELATDVWYQAMTGLSASASFENAALAQFFQSLRFGAEVNTEVACAWIAVGVGSPSKLPWALYAKDCTAPAAPPPPPPAPPGPGPAPGPTNLCAGHGDNLVCDPADPTLAAICRGGLTVGARTCADRAQACKPASASDPTATIDLDGSLVCQ